MRVLWPSLLTLLLPLLVGCGTTQVVSPSGRSSYFAEMRTAVEGKYVIVEGRDRTRTRGRVHKLDQETLHWTTLEGEPRRTATADLHALHVVTKSGAQTAKGALIGAAIALPIALLTALSISTGEAIAETAGGPETSDAGGTAALIVLGVGAGLGALFGLASGERRVWLFHRHPPR